MRKGQKILLILLGLLLLNSCNLFTKPGTIVYDAQTNITINLTSVIIIPDSTSGLVQDNINNPQVIFWGTLLNLSDSLPVSNAKIRIVGTDSPGQTVYTQPNGSWEAILPIVPSWNDENITVFVIEVQHNNAKVAPLASFCKNDQLVYDLLNVSNPYEYVVAGAYRYNIAWDNLYRRIEFPLYVQLQQ